MSFSRLNHLFNLSITSHLEDNKQQKLGRSGSVKAYLLTEQDI